MNGMSQKAEDGDVTMSMNGQYVTRSQDGGVTTYYFLS
jgi:hypothetical protein